VVESPGNPHAYPPVVRPERGSEAGVRLLAAHAPKWPICAAWWFADMNVNAANNRRSEIVRAKDNVSDYRGA
jgi:hypothetical protein